MITIKIPTIHALSPPSISTPSILTNSRSPLSLVKPTSRNHRARHGDNPRRSRRGKSHVIMPRVITLPIYVDLSRRRRLCPLIRLLRICIHRTRNHTERERPCMQECNRARSGGDVSLARPYSDRVVLLRGGGG